MDVVVVVAYAGAFAVVAISLGAGRGGPWDLAFAHPLGGHLLRLATLTVPVMLGLALFEASEGAATPGKRLMGLRVMGVWGERLSLRRAFMRNVIKFLPWELSHAAVHHVPGWPTNVERIPFLVGLVLSTAWVLCVLYLWLLLRDPSRGPPHDRMTRTKVAVAG